MLLDQCHLLRLFFSSTKIHFDLLLTCIVTINVRFVSKRLRGKHKILKVEDFYLSFPPQLPIQSSKPQASDVYKYLHVYMALYFIWHFYYKNILLLKVFILNLSEFTQMLLVGESLAQDWRMQHLGANGFNVYNWFVSVSMHKYNYFA